MSLATWLQAHRRSFLFLMLALVLAGVASLFTLPVSLFPDVSFPRVRVDIDAGARPADQMVVAVTRPIAEAIRAVPGVRNVRSTTSRGSAQVNVDFDWGADMSRAFLEVNAAMSQVLPELPPDTRIHAERMSPSVDEPVLAYSIRSDTLTQAQLYDLAQYQLRPLLAGVKGVAVVDVQGAGAGELHIDIDPAKLRAQHLTMDQVTQAVSGAIDITALGRLADHYKLFLLLADNQPISARALADVVIRAGPGGVVTVGDVATVQRSTRPEWIRTVADGRPAILVQVFQQPAANSLAMVDAVKARIADYAPQMPKGVTIAAWYDQTQLVRESAGSVRDAILIGIGLAALVLFVFLRNSRVILIALLVVPGSLAITTLLLGILGMSFNMMTLGGMAAAVGLLIDDVVVMTEHIMRRVRDLTGPVRERIFLAAREFTRPQSGSSLATIVIFLPLAFLGGVAGAFFKALSLTMAVALVVSWLLTLFAVPLLAQWLLGERDALQRPPSRPWRRLMSLYEKVLLHVLEWPALLLIGLLPLVLLGLVAFRSVGSGFLPQMDEGGFTLDYLSPPGTSLEETDRLLEKVGAILAADPYVASWSRRTGLQLGGGLTEANAGDFFVRLKSGARPPTTVVMEHVREQVVAQVPGLDVDASQLLEDMIGDLTSAPQPIVVKLFSDNVAQLDAAARKVAGQLRKVAGVVSVHDGIHPAGDALEVHVDPVRAALLGMDPRSVASQVAAAVAGSVAARLPEGPRMVSVRVWLPPQGRAETGQLEALPITNGRGQTFPLARVATVTKKTGQSEIDQENLKRMVAVSARISGRSVGATATEAAKMLARPHELPPGMYYEMGGLYRQQQIAFRGMAIVLAAAIALEFTLLLFLYESFRAALVVLVQPLLAICAVFIGLWATGIELDIASIMGMTMIVGIVTELAVFYFSELAEAEANAAIEDPPAHRSLLLEAGRKRMRAIVMSAIAMILTLLPLALAWSHGAQMQQPLAVAIISGMLVAPPLVLIVMPALYALLVGRKPGHA